MVHTPPTAPSEDLLQIYDSIEPDAPSVSTPAAGLKVFDSVRNMLETVQVRMGLDFHQIALIFRSFSSQYERCHYMF